MKRILTTILILFYIKIIAQDCKCKLSAYIIDADTTGTNIREEPNGKVKTVIFSNNKCHETPTVEIHNSKKSWIYLTTNPIVKCVKKETGWIYGGLVFTSLNYKYTYNDKTGTTEGIPVNVYEKQSISSRVINKFYDNHTNEVNIIGCCDDWAYVKGINKKTKKEIIGWIKPSDLCSNPYTICN